MRRRDVQLRAQHALTLGILLECGSAVARRDKTVDQMLLRGFVRRIAREEFLGERDRVGISALRTRVLRQLQHRIVVLRAQTFPCFENPVIVEIGKQVAVVIFDL